MEQTSSRKLKYITIAEAANNIVKYIHDRKTGITKSLKTSFEKFNYVCLGGFEPNCVYTIAGISGSGKSSFLNRLETDLVDLNPNENIAVLNFNLEMLSSRQIGRKLSRALKITTSELYSGRDYLTNYDYKRVTNEVENIKHYPIYYVDKPGNVDEIRNTVMDFMENEGKGKWVIITLDHTLLVKKKQGEDERRTLSELQDLFVELKKYGKNTIIQLSQMNRNIESVERIKNISMHYPMRTDIFGGDSIFQASDVVMVIHRPELILKEGAYGLGNLPIGGLIYLHFLKVREGELGIVLMENNLKHNTMQEIDLDEYMSRQKDESETSTNQ